MSNYSLNAISPIDGRYFAKTKVLNTFFSESSLIRYRLKVEIEYFISLCELPLPQLKNFNLDLFKNLRSYYKDFNASDAQRVKDIEVITNHDVKAVEYFIKERMEKDGIGDAKEFVHFGLTSQDINNTAIPMSIKDALEEVYQPAIASLIKKLEVLSNQWSSIPMLAKTHGQPASPTNLGKELYVFVERLNQQLETVKSITHAGKFGGATGNFNAHHVAFKRPNWLNGLDQNPEEAAQTRQKLLNRISNEDMLIIGFHLPKGGIGRVAQSGTEYSFVSI